MKHLAMMAALAATAMTCAADEAELARAEFAKYCRMATGNAPAADAVKFVIDAAISKTGNDAYAIRSDGDGVTITGSNGRSLFYGVYDLLERRAGCRWFWDGDKVPHRERIDLSGLDVREEARFEYRAIRYFAHRGLTRFQAEHWGPEEWKREIDWCLKRRLNCFMPRIGMDDTWQKAFPEIVPYPDPAAPADDNMKGFNNRVSGWGLKYRGELRKLFTDYAFARGLMIPTDFGTMTHWYARTPTQFLERKNPPFLPISNNQYPERTGLVWDVFRGEWLDDYWHLTEAFLGAGYGRPDLLHTIGLGERMCFEDREKNLQMKKAVLRLITEKALSAHPDSKILLAGWDFYSTWKPEEVRSLIPHLDPKRVMLWDYEAEADLGTDYYTLEKPGDFTQWGVVGRFPYTFGIFLAYENALDVRARYETIEKREKVAADDPFCRGYILWPESSHTDTLLLRYFTANAWKPGQTHDALLPQFCRDRYGEDAAAFESAWRRTIPISNMQGWGGNWGSDLIYFGDGRGREETKFNADRSALESAPGILADLAAIDPKDDFARRDMMDLARTVLDRRLIADRHSLLALFDEWCAGKAGAAPVKRAAESYLKLVRAATDLLALHTDYSLCESLDRLAAVRRIEAPDFDRVLLDNASCDYCRSHQYEIAAGWYLPFAEDVVAEFKRKLEAGDRTAIGRPFLDAARTARKRELDEKRIFAFRPALPRTAAEFRRVMHDAASAMGAHVAGAAGVEFVECPKCEKRIRVSDDGETAYVNLCRTDPSRKAEMSARALRLLEHGKPAETANPLTPLMGWSSWNTFGVEISEDVILGVARAMATNGLKAAGYVYVNIDDGYFDGHGPDGRLRFHPRRFPNGMKGTVDGIHALGMRAGAYSDAGADTCGSLFNGDRSGIGAGLYGHDAADCSLYFGELGFDFFKVDYCGGMRQGLDERTRYCEIASAIKATGRGDVRLNICRWAFPGTWAARVAGSWRTTHDIRASWGSIRNIVLENIYLSAYASPGHFNDMDMLEAGQLAGSLKTAFGGCGDTGLTRDEETAHFGLWCIMSSPLVLGCDVRGMSADTLRLVTNPHLIRMNQDALGLQAYVADRDGDSYVLVKDAGMRFGKSRYVALWNAGDEEREITVRTKSIDLGGKVAVFDLVERADVGEFEGEASIRVRPHAAKFYLLDAERRVEREVYEAETAFLTDYSELDGTPYGSRESCRRHGRAYCDEIEGASGGVAVVNLGGRETNDIVWRDVFVSRAGRFRVSFRCRAQTGGMFYVQTDGGDAVPLKCPASGGGFADVALDVALERGAHTVRLFNPAAPMPDIDYMNVENTTDAQDKLNAAIDARIERFRKADGEFAVPGLAAGAEVFVEQIESDFKFGCNIFNFDQFGDGRKNAEYRSAFLPGGLFNAATVPFYWDALEPEKGRPRYAKDAASAPEYWKTHGKDDPAWRRPAPDAVLDFLDANGISAHGHAIIYCRFHPKWACDKAMDGEARWGLYAGHIAEIGARYASRIPQWDVVNESIDVDSPADAPREISSCDGAALPEDCTLRSFRAAAEAFPGGVRKCINGVYVGDNWPAFISKLVREDAPIEVIGHQMHIFGEDEVMKVAAGEEVRPNLVSWAVADQIAMLKRYDEIGLPVHVSEITIPAPVTKMPRDEAEALQARVLRDNYRLWFSWPSVYRITYWNLVDGMGHEVLESGLLRNDLTKKPAYHALWRLVNEEWRTRTRVAAAAGGKVRFRGFKGRYRLSWKGTDGEEASRIVDLR